MSCRIRFEAAGNVILVDDLAWRRKKSRPAVGGRGRRAGQLGRPGVLASGQGEPRPAS